MNDPIAQVFKNIIVLYKTSIPAILGSGDPSTRIYFSGNVLISTSIVERASCGFYVEFDLQFHFEAEVEIEVAADLKLMLILMLELMNRGIIRLI